MQRQRALSDGALPCEDNLGPERDSGPQEDGNRRAYQALVLANVLEPAEVERAGTTDHAVHNVALFEQKLRKVRPILTGDPRDERVLGALSGVVIVGGCPFHRAGLRTVARLHDYGSNQRENDYTGQLPAVPSGVH